MKKKILSLLLVSVMGLSLMGCGEQQSPDIINRSTEATQENRFIEIGDEYTIQDFKYKVYYDRITNIVYLSNNIDMCRSSIASLTPLIGADKLPITLEEYNATK